MQSKNLLFLGMVLIILAVSLFGNFQSASAGEDDSDILSTLGQAGKGMGQTEGDDGAPKANFATIIGQVIKVILAILGIIFLILIVYAGILWMTAAGEKEDIDKAQRMITQGVIGLAITLAAYTISYFVVENLTAAVSTTK
ncbi:hypothetical protein HZB94_04665 [Candidatus Falkowbacteria bacterium]|nr:hypothetical protein [Candidatus Falkowbacteria bacterium]